MALPPLQHEVLRPYVAPVIITSADGSVGRAFLELLVNEIRGQVERPGARLREVISVSEPEESGELLLQSIVYCDSGRPAWIVGEPLNDQRHELIIVAARANQAALTISDGAMRDRVMRDLECAHLVSRERIAAFIGEEAKAVWLNGIHTPTATKADTKALTGTSLEYAIDPIGDQTYYYSAARTMVRIPGIEGNDGLPASIGAAPGAGRVWLRRAKDWEDFKVLTQAILDHTFAGALPNDLFSTLAQTVDDPAGVADAYSISIVPEELLSEDNVDAESREKARRWAYEARFEVFDAHGLSFKVHVELSGTRIGTLELGVELEAGRARLTSEWINEVHGCEVEREECLEFLGDPERIKIYYESSHTISQGRCYSAAYRDQRFPWKFEDFTGYNVCKEKPSVPAGQNLAACIATNDDTSLFAWVVEKLFTDENGNPTGWLASDDGSMELADFIHLDTETQLISLVHVKASGNANANRPAAPAEYEVVVGQAVKNLRHLDRRNLIDELEAGKAHKIGAAVWHNGVKQPDREGFLNFARTLPRTAPKQLIVLQPRVTDSEHRRCWANDASPVQAMRIKQIDTLLLAARASALACGAHFAAIGAKIP